MYLLSLMFFALSSFAQTTTTVWDAKFNFLKEDSAQIENTNLTPEMLTEATGDYNSKACSRILHEYEKKSLYSSESFKELVIPWGNTKVTITSEGCTDVAYKHATASDFSGTSKYPENIVLPVKSGETITTISAMSEDKLSANMKVFFDDIKAKLADSYTIDGTKEIIIYATASKEAPSCNAPAGYDKALLVATAGDLAHLSKSFDSQTSISNSELAFKRSLNLAKLLKKFVLDPYVSDNGKAAIKIRTKCTYGTAEAPKLEIYGMLKKFEWPTNVGCGVAVNLPGIVGNKTPPDYITGSSATRKFMEFTGAGTTANPPFYQIPDDGTVKYTYSIGTDIPITTSCYKRFKGTDGYAQIYLKDKTDIEFNGKKWPVKNMDDCFKLRCGETYLKLNKDIKKLTPYEWIKCAAITATTTSTTNVAPGNFMVANTGVDNSLTLASTSFKKGERIQLLADAYYVPDRFILTLDKKIILDTGFVSSTNTATNMYTCTDDLKTNNPTNRSCRWPSLTDLGQTLIFRSNSVTSGNFDVTKAINYVFPADASNAQIKLHSFGPFGTTIWRTQINCPDQGATTPYILLQAETEIKKMVP